MEIFMKFKSLIIVFIFAISSGCSMAPKNLVDSANLKAGSGVLVVGLHTDWEGHDNPMLTSLKLNYIGDGESSFDYRSLVFQGANHVSIIELPAKKYRFYMQSFGNRYLDLDDESSVFVIEPNVVTYIGDITSNVKFSGFSTGFSMKVEDRFDEIKTYLNKMTPKLLSKYGLEKQLVPLKVSR